LKPLDEMRILLAKRARLEQELKAVDGELQDLHKRTILWCVWCGEPATHIVVRESRITWRACDKHKNATYEETGRIIEDSDEMALFDALHTVHGL
jgi:hypothetical protein